MSDNVAWLIFLGIILTYWTIDHVIDALRIKWSRDKKSAEK